MAKLLNPNLSIRLIAGTSNTQTSANVKVELTPFELFLLNSGGARLLLTCQLWGADSGFNGGDDHLFSFPHQIVNESRTFTFNSTVSRSVLDEDNVGNDEIYAKFILQSREDMFPLDIRVNSPEISGDF